jgi:hypothetical protein
MAPDTSLPPRRPKGPEVLALGENGSEAIARKNTLPKGGPMNDVQKASLTPLEIARAHDEAWKRKDLDGWSRCSRPDATIESTTGGARRHCRRGVPARNPRRRVGRLRRSLRRARGVIKTPARVSGNAIGGNADYRNARGQRFRGAALMPSELSPSEWHWV